MKTKRRKYIIVTFVIFSITLLAVTLINHNKDIRNLKEQDVGTFGSGFFELEGTGTFGLSLFDSSIDTEFFENEWGVLLDTSNKYFAYKEGYTANGDELIVGTWEREDSGDYRLYVDGKLYAHIIDINTDNCIVESASNYLIYFINEGNYYIMEKRNSDAPFYFTRQ